MKEIDEKDLDTAIALGGAICDELGIYCEKRGQVIFEVYKKLRELEAQKRITDESELVKAAEKGLSPDKE